MEKEDSQGTITAYHALPPIDIKVPYYWRQLFPLQSYPKRLNVKTRQQNVHGRAYKLIYDERRHESSEQSGGP